MKTVKPIICIALLATSLTTTSCLKNKFFKSTDPETNPGFTFETTKLCKVNLDFKLNNYSIIAELYSEDPLDEYGSKKENLQPIYTGITDKTGKISDDVIDLPKGIKTVYFYTDYVGVQNVIPIKVENSSITFSIPAGTKSSDTKILTRSVSTKGSSHPANVEILATSWDKYGRPDNLATRVNPPVGLYSRISKVVNGKEGAAKHLLGKNTELNITKNTKVKLVFVDENASFRNSLCYYCYKTGQKPTDPKDVKLIVAFPNLSLPEYKENSEQKEGLSTGDNVDIKYWDGTQFHDEFPAGTTIALAVLSSSYSIKEEAIQSNKIAFYAESSYNTTEPNASKDHVIVLYDKPTDTFVHMVEDRQRNGEDNGNFKDAIMYFQPTVKGAISGDNMEELPGAEEVPIESTMEYSGTIAFEDQWPAEGDYDMNDVVIEYTSTLYRDNKNMVTKTVDVIKIVNREDSNKFPCYFGYQFTNVRKVDIVDIQISPVPTETNIDKQGMEVDNDKPTVMLFKDNKNYINSEFTVTTTFTRGLNAKDVIPPYNPFIAINERGRELHLTNNVPTSMANPSYFGQWRDRSNVSKGIYYVSEKQSMPFAIKIPIKNFLLPEENKRIDIIYPKFTNWVVTNGNEDSDWYKNPIK